MPSSKARARTRRGYEDKIRQQAGDSLLKLADELYVTNRDDWREWLRKNSKTKKEIWLIYYKKHTGKPSIPYDDSVEEALCFGWIDNIVKRIDDEKFVRKFTPRKAKSKWSETNKKRARKMVKEGKMTEAGLARIREAEKTGEWFKTAPAKKELVIPPCMKEALAKNKKASENFNDLAESYKRQYVGWISSAKREETRRRRLAEAIKLLQKNEKLGMK
jgi:uncharacterized protein YdeI (YjbR/CyaY-like superfamily)